MTISALKCKNKLDIIFFMKLKCIFIYRDYTIKLKVRIGQVALKIQHFLRII